MEKQNNPLLCDIETGMCETSDGNADTSTQNNLQSTKKSVKLIYYTDPICSSCWGIEPQLRKLKLEYGDAIEIEYRMGGLLPDWNYNSGGIGKPSDVASHWDEVSDHYDMPMDGDVWLEDPLHFLIRHPLRLKRRKCKTTKKQCCFFGKSGKWFFYKRKISLNGSI